MNRTFLQRFRNRRIPLRLPSFLEKVSRHRAQIQIILVRIVSLSGTPGISDAGV